MSRTNWFRVGAALAGLSVIMLAMAAHWLEKYLPPEKIRSVETAAGMQFMHALALIMLSHANLKSLPARRNRNLFVMLAGLLLFSGSIYLLSLREVLQAEALSALWPLTPAGGLILIVSWFLLVFERKSE